MFSESSKSVKRLYIKHLSDFRSTSKTIKKVSFLVPKCTFLRNSKIAETIVYVTFERFFVSKIGTSQTFEKVDSGSLTSSQMLIFKAPGDFSTFSKTADRAPKGGPKDAPLDPPKTHSKIDIEIQEALRRLYINCFGTPEPTRKSNSKIRGGRKGPKSRFSKKCPKFPFRTPRARFAQTLRFSVFRQLSARAGDPIGAPNRAARVGKRARPKATEAKSPLGPIRTVGMLRPILT